MLGLLRIITILIVTFNSLLVYSQSYPIACFHMGISLKVAYESREMKYFFNCKKGQKSFSIGLGVNFYYSPQFLAIRSRSINFNNGLITQILFSWYQNSLGNSIIDINNYDIKQKKYKSVYNKKQKSNSTNLTFSFAYNLGSSTSNVRFINYQQLFHQHSPSSFQNEHEWSFILGTHLSKAFYKGNYDVDRINNKWQCIGFISTKLKNISILYYNDGPPFSGWLGDGYDRFWTGGGYLKIDDIFGIIRKSQSLSRCFVNNINPWKNLGIINFRFGFERFTSDEHASFVLSNALSLNHLRTTNNRTAIYNQGSTYFEIFQENGLGLKFHLIGNYDSDIQDNIHIVRRNARHPFNGENRFQIGFIFNGNL